MEEGKKIAGNLTGGTAPRAIVRRDSNHGTNSAALDLKFVVVVFFWLRD
jgi:hypothetical protein